MTTPFDVLDIVGLLVRYVGPMDESVQMVSVDLCQHKAAKSPTSQWLGWYTTGSTPHNRFQGPGSMQRVPLGGRPTHAVCTHGCQVLLGLGKTYEWPAL